MKNKKKNKPENLYTVMEIAKKYDCCSATIYAAIHRGRIKTNIIDNQIFISVDDCKRYFDTLFSRKEAKFNGSPLYASNEISPKDARAILNITTNRFYHLLRKGTIPSYRKNVAYIIKKSDLKSYMQSTPSRKN